MSGFFTKVEVEPSKEKISHKDSVLLIGSCFTDEIGGRFERCGFEVLRNPFGIMYNPLSIANCLKRIADREYFEQKDLIKSGEYYFLFSAHGDYRDTDSLRCLDKINRSIDEAYEFLKKCKQIFLTLGSSWTYWYRPSDYLMANCHKIDNKLIDRRLCTFEHSAKALTEATDRVEQRMGRKYNVIFTISPIRHWKEGYRDNLISKSHLVLAVEKLRGERERFSYFPSYEIVMDELRDYRFYGEDMLHISSTAAEYIWEKFSQTYFGEEDRALNKRFFKLWAMENHRPLNPESDQYREHLKKTEALKKELQGYSVKQL